MKMINRLLHFLNDSPVNFLAVDSLEKILKSCGFEALCAEDDLGDMTPGRKFYVKKNDSSLYAFHLGDKPMAETGVHLICAHCDSPTFRIKPHAEMCSEGMVRLNTEVYGGPILSTWFDRPLSLAGRVILKTDDVMHPESRLMHVRRPLMQISNLAIHFNRQVNDGVKLSRQKDMLPIMGLVNDSLEKNGMLVRLICDELDVKPQDILDFDLYLYDTTPACLFGVNNEFISSGRLDDLSMIHAALEAMVSTADASGVHTRVMAIFDNEETGSQTKQGAGSPFLSSLMERVVLAQENGNRDRYLRCIERSFMVSADNAHAWHPNYAEKYDPTNHPRLGGGPVIKYNAAQKYASDAVSASVFSGICSKAGIPVQYFVNHSDVAGGSTLGNILASSLPLRGVDMGNPILAMHSVRETGAVADQEYCVRAFRMFYEL